MFDDGEPSMMMSIAKLAVSNCLTVTMVLTSLHGDAAHSKVWLQSVVPGSRSFSEILWLKLNGFLAEKGADISETGSLLHISFNKVVAREIPDSLRLSKRDYAYGYWQPPTFAASLGSHHIHA
jgi:hypothetical protein